MGLHERAPADMISNRSRSGTEFYHYSKNGKRTVTHPTKYWWWCIVMVERVWGDGDPPLTPTVEGSMGEIKKYISSPKPMQDYLNILFANSV
ncbi:MULTISPECIES: hypothetical protein [unclassified Okeania]|uniref:hypothetical protein n=1 Tax=unclassified Okeania TaxID=2634635 RepID=UPI0013BAFE15|nr:MULTISPECIES: hypothetical protein [unclassified Okeania]NES77066.1 hypothetical protein [Okeania sp. SIO1H4]NES88055.1 hypothetical protein [Okeania sp. SIO2B9]NET18561.1 hypothetical protein [Okeania sp. SIO1H5]NET76637.1 hypothetical protein [Okeania sp. SIO1F9]